jgi:hypothetical protein
MTTAAAPTLRDSLAASRLAHRQSRLRLVLDVLDARVRELGHRGERIPDGLLEAVKGFEEDLADVRARAAQLDSRLARTSSRSDRLDDRRYRFEAEARARWTVGGS